jgi:hypothetical protein
MSQIPRSQLSLKKRNVSTPDISSQKVKKSQAHEIEYNNEKVSNGQSKNSDKDVIIIDDEFEAIPVGREEIIEQTEDSPSKRKRGKLSKDTKEELVPLTDDSAEKRKRGRPSKDSRESSSKKTEESIKNTLTEAEQAEIDEEILKHVFADDFTPDPSPKESKVVKLNMDVLPDKKRRSDRLENASTIVNLSSASSIDQSTKVSNDTVTETPQERRIGGRRSTRPIDDIKYSYRSPNPEDTLNASTNATIGSEIADSMLETPAHDRKRRVDSIESIESPMKRSRLDLSGLFSNFASPVSLLRNKFRKANISSTPKIEDIANDSLESNADMEEIDLKSDKIEIISTDKKGGDENLLINAKPIKKMCLIM